MIFLRLSNGITKHYLSISTIFPICHWLSYVHTTDQILTPLQLFEWAVANILGIQFFFVSTEDIQSHESVFALEERYWSIKTIPGTRSHHSFVPISSDSMQMRRISADTVQSVIHLHFIRVDTFPSDFVRESEDTYQPGRYVACTYDNQWHIGNIVERSDANKDLLINFMERKEETRLLWPRKADKC